MRKYLVGLSVLLTTLNTTFSQPPQLMIKGYGKDLHLDHKVSPKEGLFSIGRFYNVHPKAIASYNKLDMAKGLTVGQLILIPLTDTNFSQASNKGTPIYYTVGTKETLQKVSNLNNQVSLENLREWNNLSKDDLAAGKKLIVGYLVTGENAAAIAQEKKESKELTEKQTVGDKKNEQEKPVVKNESPKENNESIKENKKTEPEKSVAKNDSPKEDKKTDKDKPTAKNDTPKENKKTEPVAIKPPATATAQLAAQGYFKTDFDQQVRSAPVSKSETVTSGIFKMNSRPREVKYYLLADGVIPGTIVRIINPDNNKAIYAKVLGEMSGVRQNQGLDIRISNTAASSLGITDTDKFIVQINY